jgi:hypothetical protein
MLIFPLPNVANILILLAYGSKSSTSQKQSKSRKQPNSVNPLAPQFKQSFTWGQSAVVTGSQLLAHTLIPAQPPLPVFSFLLPVVPPECMPKLQLSTAKSQKLMQEKETAICKKNYKKHVLRNAGEIL